MTSPAGTLAGLIESYLEADDGTSSTSTTAAASPTNGNTGSIGSTSATALTDQSTRVQVQQLSQAMAQLKKDNKKLGRELDALKNNLQMSTLLPLLMPQTLNITQETIGGSTYTTSGTSVEVGGEISVQQSNMLTALLPALMMSSDGDSGSGSTSNMSMMVLALALSGQGSSGSTTDNTGLLLAIAMMGQNQSSTSDSSSD